MELPYSRVLWEEVVEDCLLSAGRLGQALLAQWDWERCTYELLQIAGVSEYPSRYRNHVVPHLGGPGTFETPDNHVVLADRIRVSGASLVTRDFALDTSHRLMPEDRSAVLDDGVYYFYNGDVDHRDHLLRVIALARSWTFLGMTCAAQDLDALASGEVAGRIAHIRSLILPVYSGDTFIEVAP